MPGPRREASPATAVTLAVGPPALADREAEPPIVLVIIAAADVLARLPAPIVAELKYEAPDVAIEPS